MIETEFFAAALGKRTGKSAAFSNFEGMGVQKLGFWSTSLNVYMIDEINRIADFLGHDATDFLILSDTETRWKVMRVG